MIDIHCHLLPGVDDGPQTLAQALQLAQQAADDGTTHAVVTPHIHVGRWDNHAQLIDERVRLFREHLMEEGVPLFVGGGAEVRIGPELPQLIEKHQVPFLGYWGERRVMLLEFPHAHMPGGSEKLVLWLLQRDILPLIAHPERNKDVMRNIDKLSPYIEMGCLLQVTAGALVGQFGDRARQRAVQLLEAGRVTVLASDAHHVGRRPANLSVGHDAAVDLVGERAARKLVYDNPLEIVRHQFVELGCI